MNQHSISINRRALNHIKNGSKTVEGRLKKGIFKSNPILIGDIINFINLDQVISVIVKAVYEFDNIKYFLEDNPIHNLTPYYYNTDDVLNHYKNFYSLNALNKSPFLAIHIKLIEN